jgi:hypothetical protein
MKQLDTTGEGAAGGPSPDRKVTPVINWLFHHHEMTLPALNEAGK